MCPPIVVGNGTVVDAIACTSTNMAPINVTETDFSK
jgi:hypothetical protein